MRERLRTKFGFRALGGFQWYMQKWKAKPVTRTAHFHPGDLVIIPSDNADPLPISRGAVDPLD